MANANKTIWLVISNRWYSAVTAYGISCGLALEARGFETVLTQLEGSPGHLKAVALGMSTKPMKAFGVLQCPAFRRLYDSIKPSAIFVFGGAETSLLFSISTDVPIIRFRGQDGELHKQKAFSNLWHLKVSAFLTPSRAYQKAFALHCKQPVHFVPFGLSEKDMYFQEASQRGARPTLLLVGRLDPVKGHAAFFRLFKSLLAVSKSPEDRPFLKILGEEANLTAKDLHEAAAALGLQKGKDYSIDTERCKDLRTAMNQAAVGLISSLGSEVICRVGAEFLMCGTSIMVTKVGSLEELLFPGAGKVYYEDTPEGVMDFISKAFSEDKAARAARHQEAKKRFSLQVMGAQLTELLASTST